MGFSGIGAYILIFFSLIIVVSVFVLIQANIIETSSLIYSQRDRLASEMRTNIEIENISFDNLTSPDTTTAQVKNTGQTVLETDYIDVYVDRARVPRNPQNLSISFAAGSNTLNPLHWDPDETIIIEVYMDLDNSSHTLVVATEHLGRDQGSFTG